MTPEEPAAPGAVTATGDSGLTGSDQDARGPMPEPVAVLHVTEGGHRWLDMPQATSLPKEDYHLYSAEQMQAVMDERDEAIGASILNRNALKRRTAERDAIAKNSNIAHQKMVNALEQVSDERERWKSNFTAMCDVESELRLEIDRLNAGQPAIERERADYAWRNAQAIDKHRMEFEARTKDEILKLTAERDSMQAMVDAARTGIWFAVDEALAALDALRKEQGK